MVLAALLLDQWPADQTVARGLLEQHGYVATPAVRRASSSTLSGTFRHRAAGFEGFWYHIPTEDRVGLSIHVEFKAPLSADVLRKTFTPEERIWQRYTRVRTSGKVSVYAGSLPKQAAPEGAPTWENAVTVLTRFGKVAGGFRRKLTDREKESNEEPRALPPSTRITSLSVYEAYDIAKRFKWPDLVTAIVQPGSSRSMARRRASVATLMNRNCGSR